MPFDSFLGRHRGRYFFRAEPIRCYLSTGGFLRRKVGIIGEFSSGRVSRPVSIEKLPIPRSHAAKADRVGMESPVLWVI